MKGETQQRPKSTAGTPALISRAHGQLHPRLPLGFPDPVCPFARAENRDQLPTGVSARAAQSHPSHSWLFKPQSQPCSSSRSGDAQAGGWRQHPRWDCSQCCSIPSSFFLSPPSSSSSLLDNMKSAPGRPSRACPAVLCLFSPSRWILGTPEAALGHPWGFTDVMGALSSVQEQEGPEVGPRAAAPFFVLAAPKELPQCFLQCDNTAVEKNRNCC